MRTRNRSLTESFWARVNKTTDNECWEWQGSLQHHGYGVIEHKNFDRKIRATHLSLFIHNGEWPSYVMHLCDNPPCVNPLHLKQATHLENMQDLTKKKRRKNQYANRTHCSAGHLYTEGSYYIVKKGSRQCKECHKNYRPR